jgi:hypothetical protein
LAAVDWQLQPKENPPPVAYVVSVLGAMALFQVGPYVEELVRGLRYRSKHAEHSTTRFVADE